MMDGTILVIGYLVGSALSTVVLFCAFNLCGRTDATLEHRANAAHSRRFTRAEVKVAHAHHNC
jgi:hypothetical protein